MARCLFLTPLKPPDHPVPSGDRTIARLMMRLLARTGFSVELASRLITRVGEPSPCAFEAIEAAAEAEIARLLEAERQSPEPPAMVFCYHNFYRAPDLIGPRLAAALGIPYLIAEASRAPKRAGGPFARWHAWSEAACDAARLILTPSAHDREMLERLRPAKQHLVDLKPFFDPEDWPMARQVRNQIEGSGEGDSAIRLLTVGMMRPGNKLESYRLLAEALDRVTDRPWHLTIAGSGTAEEEVATLFQAFGTRVRRLGAVSASDEMSRLYSRSDLFVWPACDEPLGMVFLEAAAHGLASVAGSGKSVADVVEHGVSGLIAPNRDAAAFATLLAGLLDDGAKRAALAASARRFAWEKRTISQAEIVMRSALGAAGLDAGRSEPSKRVAGTQMIRPQ